MKVTYLSIREYPNLRHRSPLPYMPLYENVPQVKLKLLEWKMKCKLSTLECQTARNMQTANIFKAIFRALKVIKDLLIEILAEKNKITAGLTSKL